METSTAQKAIAIQAIATAGAIQTAQAQATATAVSATTRAVATEQAIAVEQATRTAIAGAAQTATMVTALGEIAYVKAEDIYVIKVATQEERRLTFSQDVSSVTWAPNRQWISFARPSGLYIMRPDGSELQEIRNSPDNEYPTYSADGSLYFPNANQQITIDSLSYSIAARRSGHRW